MKTFLYAVLVLLFGLAIMDHRETQDYSRFDSIILESQKLQDSALCELEEMVLINDSLMDKAFKYEEK